MIYNTEPAFITIALIYERDFVFFGFSECCQYSWEDDTRLLFGVNGGMNSLSPVVVHQRLGLFVVSVQPLHQSLLIIVRSTYQSLSCDLWRTTTGQLWSNH